MATENETTFQDLTPAQLESWKRDGFLYIKAQDFWSPQQIENLKKVPSPPTNHPIRTFSFLHCLTSLGTRQELLF